jgi:hypothetical protein
MSIINFPRIDSEQNTAGYSTFYFIHKSALAKNPLIHNGLIVETAITGTSKWFIGYCQHSQLMLNDGNDDSKQGKSWNVGLSGYLPVQKPEAQYLFHQLCKQELLVLVLDKNKRLRLLGDMDSPLRFKYEAVNGGYQFTMYGQQPYAAPYYVGDAMLNPSGWILDTDYMAVLNYAIANNYNLPSDGQKMKHSQLLRKLKLKGIWQKLDRFMLMATDVPYNQDLTFGLISWKNVLTANHATVRSPSFAIWAPNIGFTAKVAPNASWIWTNHIPISGPNFLQNNAHMAAWEYYDFNGSNFGIGQDSTGNTCRIEGRITTNIFRGNINSSGNYTFSVPASNGFQLITRAASNNLRVYLPTQSIDNVSAAHPSGTPANSQVTIGASNGNVAPRTYSFWSIGADLTAERFDYYAIMHEYMASL